MRGLVALGAMAAALAVPAAAQGGVVSIDGSVLRYTAAAGERDEITIRREDNGDIGVNSPGTTQLSTTSASCSGNPSAITCTGVAGSLTRIVATTLDGIDQVNFSELGTIVGEADLGSGEDVGNVLDQTTRPFRVVLRGGPGRDTLLGGLLNDVLDGGADSDLLDGGGGPDDIAGGPGFDEGHYDFIFPARTEGVRVTLDDKADDGGPGENDNMRSDVEDVFGTEHDDVLVGSDLSNVIFGLGGDDHITGGGGFDVLFGDRDFTGAAGNDTILARDGLGERVSCGAGVDTVVSDDIDGVSECETNDSSPDAVLDRDGDGSDKPLDCDDTNPQIHPGAPDILDDGIDQDCDGADDVDLDRDNDNFNRPQDCDDNRASVFPGADEIPGNGRDEDCSGADAPLPRVNATVTFDTVPAGASTRFRSLDLGNLRRGDRIRVSCSRRCGVRTRTIRARRSGRMSLRRRVRGALPARARLDIRISRARAVTVVFRLTMRAGRVPSLRQLCLPAGARRPRRCA